MANKETVTVKELHDLTRQCEKDIAKTLHDLRTKYYPLLQIEKIEINLGEVDSIDVSVKISCSVKI